MCTLKGVSTRISESIAEEAERNLYSQGRRKTNQFFMLTFYIRRVSLRAVYRTALARQSAPGWPCRGHAREGFKFAVGFCSTFR